MKKDLQVRTIAFSVAVLEMLKELPNEPISKHLSGQLMRSSTSVPLNYGEASEAESAKDFIHKLKIVLKELRESQANMKILRDTKLIKKHRIEGLIKESDELISIFVVSVATARRKA